MISGDCGIFETQSEPLFTVKPNNISSDLLEDWLFILASENYEKAQWKLNNSTEGNFKNGVAAEMVLRICEQLSQPPEVKYHSMELFDLFMCKHIGQLYKYVQDTYQPNQRQRRWREIVERVKGQLFLRALSCIQISSKLYCHSRAVTVDQLMIFLRKAGHIYRRNGIMSSELRVLKTVGYKVGFTTPLIYLETLLEALGRNDSLVDVKSLYDVGLNVLNVTYLRRNEIYTTLFKRITGKDSIEAENDTPKINLVKQDMLLLTTAIVSCSAYILNQCSFVQIVEQMHFMTRIPKDEIMDFIIVLVTEILHQDG